MNKMHGLYESLEVRNPLNKHEITSKLCEPQLAKTPWSTCYVLKLDSVNLTKGKTDCWPPWLSKYYLAHAALRIILKLLTRKWVHSLCFQGLWKSSCLGLCMMTAWQYTQYPQTTYWVTKGRWKKGCCPCLQVANHLGNQACCCLGKEEEKEKKRMREEEEMEK